MAVPGSLGRVIFPDQVQGLGWTFQKSWWLTLSEHSIRHCPGDSTCMNMSKSVRWALLLSPFYRLELAQSSSISKII